MNLLSGEAHLPVGEGEGQAAGVVQLLLGGGAVQVLQGGAHLPQLFAELLAQQPQLGLEGVGDELGHVAEEPQVLYVQLLLDDLLVQLAQAGAGVGVQAA